MSTSNYFWARWLKPALETDPFVKARLIEVPGWELRGRPVSDFAFLPSGVVDHHTACMIRGGHDPQICLNGCLAGNTVAPGPIGQLMGTWTPPGVRWNGANADPRIILMAAGRANHAGASTPGGGYPWGAPDGNGSSIGIEWCGPPEGGVWPDIVIELRARVTAAILRWNGWDARHVTTHHEYAPARKIDPSDKWAAQMGLNKLQPWSADQWRLEVSKYIRGAAPPPPLEIDNMKLIDVNDRVYDSRPNSAINSPGVMIKAGVPTRVPLSYGGLAATARFYVQPMANGKGGFLKVWDPDTAEPRTSVVNWSADQFWSDGVWSGGIGATDSCCVVVSTHDTHLIVDTQTVWAAS